MVKGFKHPLTVKDLWDLNEVDKCDFIGSQFKREWSKEVAKTR